MHCSLLAPRRRLTQYLLLAVFLLVPLLSVGGNPLLRIDLAGQSLYLAAIPFRIEEFFIILLLTLLLTVGFLVMTALLGRVWCGWLCPQTLLNDMVELLPEKIKAHKPAARTVTMLQQAMALLLALLLTLASFAYFAPVADVIRRLSAPAQHPLLFSFFVLSVTLVYLNAVVVRRSFCHSYCPYGRLQTACMNDATLKLVFREEVRERCIRCNSCVRICPMGVDIREGFQIECINCGRCLDACRIIMDKKDGSDGLIAYRFGSAADGRPKLSGSTIMLLIAFCVLSLLLVYQLTKLSGAGFAIQRNAGVPTRVLTDGSQLLAWKGVVENRSQLPGIYRIELHGPGATDLMLQGQVNAIAVAPNQNRTISFFLKQPSTLSAGQSVELLLVREGSGVVARTRLPL